MSTDDSDNKAEPRPSGKVNSSLNLFWRQPLLLFIVGLLLGPGCFYYQWSYSRTPIMVVALPCPFPREGAPAVDVNSRMNPLRVRAHFIYEAKEGFRPIDSRFIFSLQKDGGRAEVWSGIADIPAAGSRQPGKQRYTAELNRITFRHAATVRLHISPTGAQSVDVRSVTVELWRNVEMRGWPFMILGGVCLVSSVVRLAQLLGVWEGASIRRLRRAIASVFRPIGW